MGASHTHLSSLNGLFNYIQESELIIILASSILSSSHLKLKLGVSSQDFTAFIPNGLDFNYTFLHVHQKFYRMKSLEKERWVCSANVLL